jgi:hypothetical protein
VTATVRFKAARAIAPLLCFFAANAEAVESLADEEGEFARLQQNTQAVLGRVLQELKSENDGHLSRCMISKSWSKTPIPEFLARKHLGLPAHAGLLAAPAVHRNCCAGCFLVLGNEPRLI